MDTPINSNMHFFELVTFSMIKISGKIATAINSSGNKLSTINYRREIVILSDINKTK